MKVEKLEHIINDLKNSENGFEIRESFLGYRYIVDMIHMGENITCNVIVDRHLNIVSIQRPRERDKPLKDLLENILKLENL